MTFKAKLPPEVEESATDPTINPHKSFYRVKVVRHD
jgi:hypothetical protein